MEITRINKTNTSAPTKGPWQHPGLHILHALTDGALVLTREAQILHLNLAAERLLGVDGSAQGQPLEQVATFLQGDTQQPLELGLRTMHAPGFSGNFDLLLRNDGSCLPVEISVSALARQAPGHSLLLLRDASAVQHYIDKLAYSNSHDEQTRLLRRSELIRRLTRLLQDKACNDTHAFLLADINHFKSLNDAAGHAAGDAAIRQVAARLQAVIRERDTLARMGGDEFGVLLEHCPEAHARQCARLLEDAVASQPMTWGGKRIPLSISVGLTYMNDARHSVYSVLKAADMACHQAKRQFAQQSTS